MRVKKIELPLLVSLVRIIKQAIPAKARQDGPHPAKRTFQAIRIEVNRELAILHDSFVDAVSMLKPRGKLGLSHSTHWKIELRNKLSKS